MGIKPKFVNANEISIMYVLDNPSVLIKVKKDKISKVIPTVVTQFVKLGLVDRGKLLIELSGGKDEKQEF